jgi:4-hydroxybenzoate polyprenyltransferase
MTVPDVWNVGIKKSVGLTGMQWLNQAAQKFLNLLHVGRFSMSPLTISVPILGALVLSHPLSGINIVGLGIIGLCSHLFGFSLNDILDRHIDEKVPSRAITPLISGNVQLWEVWVFCAIQVPIAVGVYYFLFRNNLNGLVAIGSSIFLSIVYNLWSKQGNFPKFLAELSLALSVGLLSLAGSLSQIASLPLGSIVFSSALALILLLLNSVPSGLKDIKTDYQSGARSFVIAIGSRMLDADRIFTPKFLWAYSVALQILVYLCLALLIKLLLPSWVLIIVSSILTLYATLHLRMVLSLKSFRALRQSRPLLNGGYNYCALSLVVFNYMPLFLQIFYGLLTLYLLVYPWYLGVKAWKSRYYPLID